MKLQEKFLGNFHLKKEGVPLFKKIFFGKFSHKNALFWKKFSFFIMGVAFSGKNSQKFSDNIWSCPRKTLLLYQIKHMKSFLIKLLVLQTVMYGCLYSLGNCNDFLTSDGRKLWFPLILTFYSVSIIFTFIIPMFKLFKKNII